MGPFLSLSVYFLLVVGSIGAIVLLSAWVGRRPLSSEADVPYECGMAPVEKPESRFPSRFYKIALLFVVFDVEIVFLYLWAVALKGLGTSGLVVMIVFIAVLLAAWAYAWKKGDLQWD
ncbi:MAG: NADH-quinone oxidoreductase subunit A [Syntrophales bacterium]